MFPSISIAFFFNLGVFFLIREDNLIVFTYAS